MKVLLLSHGRLCEGMLDTLSIFSTKLDSVSAIPFYVDGINSEELLQEFIQRIEDEKVIIFTDILWGSVNQKVYALGKEKENVHIISGFNLPILLEIISSNENDLDYQSISEKVQLCKESIVYMRDFESVSLEGDE